MTPKILRLADVKSQATISRPAIYNRMSKGLFPKTVSLGGRSVGWLEHELNTYQSALVAGKDDEFIRWLVDCMVELRPLLHSSAEDEVQDQLSKLLLQEVAA